MRGRRISSEVYSKNAYFKYFTLLHRKLAGEQAVLQKYNSDVHFISSM